MKKPTDEWFNYWHSDSNTFNGLKNDAEPILNANDFREENIRRRWFLSWLQNHMKWYIWFGSALISRNINVSPSLHPMLAKFWVLIIYKIE